jgi:hypothetical protein
MRLRLGNEADCLDLQHTELRSRLPCTPHAWPEPPTARAVSFVDCLGALHFANSESDRVTGFEKVIWPEWVDFCPTRTDRRRPTPPLQRRTGFGQFRTFDISA